MREISLRLVHAGAAVSAAAPMDGYAFRRCLEDVTTTTYQDKYVITLKPVHLLYIYSGTVLELPCTIKQSSSIAIVVEIRMYLRTHCEFLV